MRGGLRRAGRERLPLPWTLEAVEAQSSNEGIPVWAQRASGAPRVSGSEDFLRALAQAGDVEEVVRVIFARAKEPRPALRQLSSPVLQVIQQIREEAHKATVSAVVEGVLEAGESLRRSGASGEGMSATTVQPRQARGQGRSTARVARGMTGLRSVATAPRSEGVGDDKVMRLAARLRELIHLAEHKNRRDEARQGVRMAEDSAAARTEGQSAPAQSEGGDGRKRQIDIDALAQEVLGLVQGELEGRKQRRPDNTGDDAFDVWW